MTNGRQYAATGFLLSLERSFSVMGPGACHVRMGEAKMSSLRARDRGMEPGGESPKDGIDATGAEESQGGRPVEAGGSS